MSDWIRVQLKGAAVDEYAEGYMKKMSFSQLGRGPDPKFKFSLVPLFNLLRILLLLFCFLVS